MAEALSVTGTLRYLRSALALLAVMLALAVTVLALSIRHHQTMRADHAVAVAELSDTREQIAAIELNERWLDEFGANFRALVASGVVGPEQRLHWAEQLDRQATEIGLASLNYELKPRESMSQPVLNNSSFQAYQSSMTVKLDLLHSLDLTRLLAHLEAGQQALVMPESCAIRRTKKPETLGPEPTLEATCLLWWVTVSERETTPTGEDDV